MTFRWILPCLLAVSVGAPVLAQNPAAPSLGATLPIVVDLPGIRCEACVKGVQERIKRFPEVVDARVDIKAEKAFMQVKPGFDQYVALLHALEEAGGAIQMFHPAYKVPRSYFATLGRAGRTSEDTEALQKRLSKIPGVRSAIIDDERWFTNPRGIDVGGVVMFVDSNPRLEIELAQVARETGWVIEPKTHGGGHGGGAGNDRDEWSEMNHAFAGLCLLFLTVVGVLQLTLPRPPPLVKYGSVVVWAILFVFLFIRSDRGSWPLGPINWFDAFKEWDTAQHRVGQGLILLIGIGDFLRIRRGWTVNPLLSRWGMLLLGVVGSGMLFTHLHQTLDPAHFREVLRMNVQHVMMATAALLFCLSKFVWDTWRVPRKGGQFLWLGFLGCLGVILTLYVE